MEKREYRKPKAVLVDFCYDEQIVATSSGTSPLGDPPPQLGKCRQSSENSCSVFWRQGIDSACAMNPFSLR